MRALTQILIGIFCFQPVFAQEYPLRNGLPKMVSAQFGIPSRFGHGTLQYPGFTVRLARKTELIRAAGQPPWIIRTFDVLKDGHVTIGGDITFNSEERANGRRFDVDGKIYIAELYYSTAGLKEGENVPLAARLADDEIIIWDETAARKGNVPLAQIWQTEKIESGARYSTPNAYSSGVFLPGFLQPASKLDTGRSRLKPDSLEVEQVTVLNEDSAAPPDGVIREYGESTDIYSGAVKYQDMTIVLVSLTANYLTNSDVQTCYNFKAYAAFSPVVGFGFDTYNLANGCRFTVNSTSYFAEMFATTAVASTNAPTNGRTNIPLRPNQLIIWDKHTALVKNPRIVPPLQDRSLELSPKFFAGGAPIGNGFTGTYFDLSQGWCTYSELDASLSVTKHTTAIYPVRFADSGYVGHVNGFLFVGPDGLVTQATTTYGSDNFFQELATQAIQAMRFTSPKRNGQPTKVRLNFSWSIAETTCNTTSVQFE